MPYFTCCKWNLFLYVEQYSFHCMLVFFGCSGEHTGTLSHCPCGAAVLLSQSRSHAGHCICVLCVTSCVRLWIVSGTMARFALKGHLNHLPLGCKRTGIQLLLPLRQYVFILLRCHLNAAPQPRIDERNHNSDMSIARGRQISTPLLFLVIKEKEKSKTKDLPGDNAGQACICGVKSEDLCLLLVLQNRLPIKGSHFLWLQSVWVVTYCTSPEIFV